jgi:hypothetical protein
MAVQIQLRNDTSTNWQTINPVLAQGEVGLERDTRKFKIGNGIDNWNDLPYNVNDVQTFIEVDNGLYNLNNVGIATTNPTSTLTVAGTGLFTGIVTASSFVGNLTGTATNAGYAQTAGVSTTSQGLTGSPNITVANLTATGISTLGTVQISSGIVTATTGIITYYGDGSKLSNIAVSGAITGSGLTMATARLLGRSTASTGAVEEISLAGGLAFSSGTLTVPVEIGLACSDETTALTTGTAKVTFRMPYAMTVTAVRSSVTTAPTGSTLVVDINEGGTSILSTKLSIDATEKTSTTAATAAVISDTALADDAEITIDIDQIGSTVAGAGLKVWIIGRRA